MRWLILGLLIAVRAHAQNVDSVRAGTRVRVWERQPDALVVGSVRSTDSQRLTLDSPSGPLMVPWVNVSHVDVSRGPKSGPHWRSGLIGGLAGAIGGGLLGAIIGDASHRNTPKFGAAGIVVGGVAGAAIGTTQPGESWRRTELTH